jgi:serine/threonine-protein kinase
VRQVADGLDAAHRLGIVHRDLKPDNILVVKDELGQEKCKIADFGIAKAIGSGEKSLTQTGFVIGTPEYMSPEQLLGEEIDHRSDIYSLALVAHQCLTNETAFDSKTPDRGMMARLTNQPRTLAHLCPDQSWPKDLQAVLNRGLDRQRARRYESAGQFAGAFEQALKSAVATPPAPRPVAPPPPPPPPRPRTPQPPVPVVKREPIVGRTSRQTPRSVPTPQRPPETIAQPTAPAMPAFRLSRLIPRLPIVRWTMTALVVGFAWLLVTEGSIPRALRKAGAIARRAQYTILGGGSGAARSTPGTAASPDGASPTETPSETPEPTMPTLSNPPSVKPPVGSGAPPAAAPPAATPPAANPPAANPPAANPPAANPPAANPPDGAGRDSLASVNR